MRKCGRMRSPAIDGLGYDAPGAKEAVTDGGGGFVIEGLPAGYVQLMATATGYHFGDIGTIHEVPETNVAGTARERGKNPGQRGRQGWPAPDSIQRASAVDHCRIRRGFKTGFMGWRGDSE